MKLHSRKRWRPQRGRASALWLTLPIAAAALGVGALSIISAAPTARGEHALLDLGPAASPAVAPRAQAAPQPELPAVDENAEVVQDHPATF